MNSLRYLWLLYVLYPMLISCHSESKSNSENSIPRVQVARATVDSLNFSIESIGYTECNYSVAVQARVNGFLLSKRFEDGMPVKRGELLYTIDPSLLKTTYLSSVAALESAKAALREAENNYERAQPLAEIEAISASKLDEYRAQLASSRASVRSAEQNLQNATIELGYSRIYSPVDGVIAASAVEVGDYVGPGSEFTQLTTISSLDTLSVTISIPILTLQRMGFTHDDFYDNEKLLSNIRLYRADGSLYPIAGVYDYTIRDVASSEGALRVVVDFANPNYRLKSGEFARVRADVGSLRAALMVPSRAVSQLQGVNSIWVVDSDSVAHFRRVKLGRVVGKNWVVEGGIEPSQMVVVGGGERLQDGIKVHIVESLN